MQEAPAFNVIAFDEEVRKASMPAPEINPNIDRFIARHAPGVTVTIGQQDGYDWRSGVLIISRETAAGKGMRALLTAAHECGHALQHRDWPWLPWWIQRLPLVPLAFEVDAWRRARMMLT